MITIIKEQGVVPVALTITVPYLCVAGEAEELSPVQHSENLVKALKGPKRMVIYQDSRHSVGNVPAANLGPFPPILVADWMADRLAGKPFPSERWYVTATGQINKTPLSAWACTHKRDRPLLGAKRS